MVFMIWLLRVGPNAIRGAAAEGIVSILFSLAIEELLIRTRGMSVSRQKKKIKGTTELKNLRWESVSPGRRLSFPTSC